MTREEHLKSCKICKNKKFDRNKGIVCKLTNEIADFEETCSNFEEDIELVKEKEYNNTKCWFCETRPRGYCEGELEGGLVIYLAKGKNKITMVIPLCIWCQAYRNRQSLFWLAPFIAGIVALTFGSVWTENLYIGAGIGIAAVFVLYRIKLNKNKKILSEYKIKSDVEAIRTYPEVKLKLDDGWKYAGIYYSG